MSRQEREEFLAGLHVGVLSVASQDGGGPLTVPVWYTYSPGGTVNVSTGRGKKVVILEPATDTIAASFEVGDRPWGIGLSPDEKLLFTANGPSNDVSVVDLATRTVTRKIKVGDRPWGVLVLGR